MGGGNASVGDAADVVLSSRTRLKSYFPRDVSTLGSRFTSSNQRSRNSRDLAMMAGSALAFTRFFLAGLAFTVTVCASAATAFAGGPNRTRRVVAGCGLGVSPEHSRGAAGRRDCSAETAKPREGCGNTPAVGNSTGISSDHFTPGGGGGHIRLVIGRVTELHELVSVAAE